jgi:hypothetical protein
MDPTDDDELLAELGAAMRGVAQVPARFVAVGKSAFAFRGISAEIAALTHDSAGAELAGTRAESAALRSLTFVASELAIELEVTADALVGQVVPPRAGEIELVGPNGPIASIAVDEVGWFAIQPAPSGPIRLHLRMSDGESIRTEWTTL